MAPLWFKPLTVPALLTTLLKAVRKQEELKDHFTAYLAHMLHAPAQDSLLGAATSVAPDKQLALSGKNTYNTPNFSNQLVLFVPLAFLLAFVHPFRYSCSRT